MRFQLGPCPVPLKLALDVMRESFTIVDSFTVTAGMSKAAALLPLGTWFVLDGCFDSVSDLPSSGTAVVVTTPKGQTHEAQIAATELRHGAAALMFAQVPAESWPRLSTVKVVKA